MGKDMSFKFFIKIAITSSLLVVASCDMKDERSDSQLGSSNEAVHAKQSPTAHADSLVGVDYGESEGVKTFWIDAFEATVINGQAVSSKGQIPKVNVTYSAAKKYCEAARKRLCSEKEWRIACKGVAHKRFGIQDTEAGLEKICDIKRTTNNTPGSLPSKTGSHASCATDGALYDMIGNVTEWVVGENGAAMCAGVAFYSPPLLGSSSDYPAGYSGFDCDVKMSKSADAPMPPTESSTDIGFRCCADPEKQ